MPSGDCREGSRPVEAGGRCSCGPGREDTFSDTLTGHPVGEGGAAKRLQGDAVLLPRRLVGMTYTARWSGTKPPAESSSTGMGACRHFSEDQHQQSDDDHEADKEDDADHAAEELEESCHDVAFPGVPRPDRHRGDRAGAGAPDGAATPVRPVVSPSSGCPPHPWRFP